MKRALVLTTILLGLVLAASTLQGAAWAAMPAPPSAGASAASQGTGHNVDLVGQMGGASLAVLGLQEPLGDRSIYSYHATVPPMLDGDLSEWQDLPVTVLDRTTADWIFGPVSNPDPANLSAEIRSMWTSTHLYFAFHVRDDHIVVDSPPPPDPDWKVWHDDEVEIGLDGDNDDAWGGAEDHQFTINPNGWKTDGGGSLTDVFQAAIVQVQGSHWDVEVAIPLDQLGGTFTEGRIIGVTFGLHDDDDGQAYETHMIWEGNYTNREPENFGDLVLTGAWTGPTATPPVTPTPTPTPTPSPTPSPTPTSTTSPTPTATPTITPTPSPTPCTDLYEPDDFWYQAKTILVGEAWQTHLHQAPGDVDYVKFTAAADQTYVIRTDYLGDGPENDTTLTLYDTDGMTPLAFNDEDPANPPASRLDWTCPADGTYYVKVAQFNPEAGGCDFTYGVNVSLSPATPTPTATATATPTTGAIAGIVYADLNRNDTPEPGEELPGVIVTVRRVDGTGTTRVTATGPDGRYAVGDLLPGLHRVEETDPRWYYSLSANSLVVMVVANATTEANFVDYPARKTWVPLTLKGLGPGM